MDYNEIAVFVRVVQAGNFKRAAEQLGMPNSTVSAKVASLEARLGVTLLQRTTRKLNVTEAGQNYYRQCLEGLEQIKHAESQVSEAQSEASGQLRITAPVELGSTMLPRIAAGFMKKFPKVALEFFLTDQAVELISENVDLAIRAGELKDSSLIAKRIGSVAFGCFSSPAYVKAHGQPQHPRDLAQHQCLQFTQLREEKWVLSSGKSTFGAPIKPRMTCNDLNMLKHLAQSGEGIALLPTFLCRAEAQKGNLLRLLPEWKTDLRHVHFVYPEQKFISPKLRAFMDFAFQPLREYMESSEA